MKKNLIYDSIFILSLCLMLIGNYYINKIRNSNIELYKYFENKEVLDTDGNVNLSSLQEEKKNLEEELIELFGEIDKDNYLEKINEEKTNNEELTSKIIELNNYADTLEKDKKSLTEEYNLLEKKYNELIIARNKALGYGEYGFPLINQYPNYPTGCESVALTTLLRYYNIDVSPDQIINNLKKESLPYYEGGTLYGGNPELGFVGNPYTSSSYGVYETPIKNVAEIYKGGMNGGSNIEFSEVEALVKAGHPVQVWISMGLSIPYISTSWTYKPTMETISWKAGEHSVIVIDVNTETVKIADPIGGVIRSYSRNIFENRYEYYGKKALYY